MTREKKQDLREQSLLQEFDRYRKTRKKHLTTFSIEAIRAGFKKWWIERDYTSIIVVARKLPEELFNEDVLIGMWYDNATIRSGGPLAEFFW